jgi:hypothetical protein
VRCCDTSAPDHIHNETKTQTPPPTDTPPATDTVYILDLFAAGKPAAVSMVAGLKYPLQDLNKPKLMHAHSRVRDGVLSLCCVVVLFQGVMQAWGGR